MSYIYKPKGRALEYAELALNIYNGCHNGCHYCYVPRIMHRTPEEFRRVKDRLDRRMGEVWREIDSQSTARYVLLCFACDPYQPLEMTTGSTRRVLEMMAASSTRLRPVILTKGYRGCVNHLPTRLRNADFPAIHARRGWFGVSLSTMDEAVSLAWEPRAAHPYERLRLLEQAKDAGLQTWVSIEPTLRRIDPPHVIFATHRVVDLYAVGPLNHHRIRETINWTDLLLEIEAILERLGKAWFFKSDALRAALRPIPMWQPRKGADSEWLPLFSRGRDLTAKGALHEKGFTHEEEATIGL